MESTTEIIPQKNLPNATAVLVLGITSIPMCCCLGGVVGLVLGIIGIVLGNKDMARYALNPSEYTLKSLKNLKAGRTCAIIGTILSAIYILFAIWLVLSFGLDVLSDPERLKEIMEDRFY